MKALLIEDNPTDALIVQRELSKSHAPVIVTTHVGSMAEARDALAEGEYDILLVDLSLPDEYGLDSVQRAMGMAPTTPAIVLTGTHDDELALACLKAGAQDYINKDNLDTQVLVHAMTCAQVRSQRQATLRDRQ